MNAAGALIQQLLPEPSPVRKYCHPSQYRAIEHVRHYSDGMHKLYQPNFFTVALSTVTLGLYIGIPHLLMGLFVASFFSRTALMVLLLLIMTLLLPAKPLRIQSVLSSYLFLCWRRYFKFSYLFEKSLDCYQDYIIAQFPHGAFPLGCILGGTFMATEYPDYHCYAMAAPSAFLVPVWRHVHAWLGTETCTKTHFHQLLSLGVNGPLKRHSSSGNHHDAAAPDTGSPTATEEAAAGSCADSAADDHGHHPGQALGEQQYGLVQRRLSLAGSIRNKFKHHHSLSDTESSDSDCEPCGCASPAKGTRAGTGEGRRLSIGSNTSSVADSLPGSVCSCTGLCGNCSPAQRHQQHSTGSSKGSSWVVDPASGKRKTGVSVGLMVGGIAEMFMIRKDHERIKVKDRKGFVRIALEHGTPILPVYMFGANQVLDFGPPWLQRLSRKMRASVGMIYGRWGLPVPRRVPIFQVTGKPLEVGPPMRKDHPDFNTRVDELHAQFISEIERLYYTHRSKYGHGFENRPLIIS